MLMVERRRRGLFSLPLATLAWLASATPAMAAWTRTSGFNGTLSAGEITVALAIMAGVVFVFVLACLRKYNYQVQLDGDRVIFWYKGDTSAQMPITNLARVRLAAKGGQTMFVERDGTKFYSIDPLAPELLRALEAKGVTIEGRQAVG